MANDRHIVHLDDDHILQADGKDLTSSIIVDDHILAAKAYMIANCAHTLLIGGEEFPILLPVAHIIPTKIDRDNRQIAGFFHNAMINGNRGERWPQFINATDLIRRAPGLDDPLNGVNYLRKVLMHLGQNGLDLPYKDARVPD